MKDEVDRTAIKSMRIVGLRLPRRGLNEGHEVGVGHHWKATKLEWIDIRVKKRWSKYRSIAPSKVTHRAAVCRIQDQLHVLMLQQQMTLVDVHWW